MHFFEGRLRIDVLDGAIDFRVIGENGTPGVEEAFEKIGLLAADVHQKQLACEIHKRSHPDGYRIDAVVIKTGKCPHERTEKFSRDYVQMERCLDCQAEFRDRTPLDQTGTNRDEVG